MALTNRLTLDTTKMDGFLLWVMLHDREPVHARAAGEELYRPTLMPGS